MVKKYKYWVASTKDNIPRWSMSSTSKYSNNQYIYMTKAVCKKCYTKNRIENYIIEINENDMLKILKKVY